MTNIKDVLGIILAAMILAALTPTMLTKCDVEYEREHPTADYISASDQVYIDLRDVNYE